jgi:hypothetical protein
MSVRHLRLANGATPLGAARKAAAGEYCLVDYSSCPTSDVCWLFDLDNSCDERDNCIIDTA